MALEFVVEVVWGVWSVLVVVRGLERHSEAELDVLVLRMLGMMMVLDLQVVSGEPESYPLSIILREGQIGSFGVVTSCDQLSGLWRDAPGRVCWRRAPPPFDTL